LRELGRAAFVARNRGWFLLKHGAESEGAEPGRIDYNTVAVRIDEADFQDPFDGQWRFVEIRKRPGNPFPERISVGRATNCDVVIRLPFVSKLHGHFSPGDGAALILSDNRSANGITVSGKTLAPGSSIEVSTGDWIGFGPLRLQLVDGSDLCSVLSEAFGVGPSSRP
jgi:hypothetical protein